MPLAAITVIRRIGELIAVPPGPVAGRAMRRVQRVPEAAVVVENGAIRWFGPEVSLNAPPSAAVVDAMGGCVVPVERITSAVGAAAGANDTVRVKPLICVTFTGPIGSPMLLLWP